MNFNMPSQGGVHHDRTPESIMKQRAKDAAKIVEFQKAKSDALARGEAFDAEKYYDQKDREEAETPGTKTPEHAVAGKAFERTTTQIGAEDEAQSGDEFFYTDTATGLRSLVYVVKNNSLDGRVRIVRPNIPLRTASDREAFLRKIDDLSRRSDVSFAEAGGVLIDIPYAEYNKALALTQGKIPKGSSEGVLPEVAKPANTRPDMSRYQRAA